MFGPVSGEARAVELVAASPASARRADAAVGPQTARLDVLVNNAGILGPLVVTQAFLPRLRRSKSPRIVNVSSGGGSLTDMGHWAPASSIMGGEAATRSVERADTIVWLATDAPWSLT